MCISSEQQSSRTIKMVKGIGILLVVLGHTKTPLSTVIYTFHMPLFFCVSGYLFNYAKWHENGIAFVKRKTCRLLVPYFVSCLLIFYPFWFFVGRHFGEDVDANYSPIGEFFGIFFANGFDQWMAFNIPLWFLPCLFLATVIFWVINSISRQNIGIMAILCIVLSVAGYTIKTYTILPWGCDIAMVVQVFMFVGLLLRKYNFDNKFLCFISILIFVIAIIINGRVDTNSRNYQLLPVYYAGGISGTIVMLYISNALTRLKDTILYNTIKKFLSFCSANSIMIMMFHFWGFKFSSVILVYGFKINSDVAHIDFWPVYVLVSLVFCLMVVKIKGILDRYLSKYNIWNTLFSW